MENINCMEISNKYNRGKWNASTNRRIKAIKKSRSKRVRQIVTHIAFKAVGAAVLYAVYKLDPAYVKVSVNALYGIAGAVLILFG